MKKNHLIDDLKRAFEALQWQDTSQSSPVVMTKNPSTIVRHRLSLHEPFSRSDLPDGAESAIICNTAIYFDELERFISSSLNIPPAPTAQLDLALMVPAQKTFCGAYLINRQCGYKGLVDDYMQIVEPTRMKLSTEEILLDSNFVPPSGRSASGWNLRRAAYYRMRLTEARWRELYSILEPQVSSSLHQDEAKLRSFSSPSEARTKATAISDSRLARFLEVTK